MAESQDEFAIYDALFEPLVEKYGPLDAQVLSSPMMMFGMSFRTRREVGLYVTYEPDHLAETESKEGLKFALFTVAKAPEGSLTELLEQLGLWFLDHKVGDGDTADLSAFDLEGLPSAAVAFSLFSQYPEGYGLFELRFIDPEDA
ncbi:MAG: hypothetical protein AAGI70_15755 [Pseudomonadota bacterium]